jgi:hypothetical protein
VIDVAGRIDPKTSPCARPMSSKVSVSTAYIRVRTTSSARASAIAEAVLRVDPSSV